MPLVQISLVEGRGADRKRELIRTVTQSIVEALEVDPAQVRVLIYELSPGAWGVGGQTKDETGA